jgi:hypothetical protein
MRPRRLMTRHDHDDARGVRHGSEANLFERRLKQRAVLKTVAAASSNDHLLHDAVEVDAYAAAEQHVHVLEGNARDVRACQAGQRLECGLQRTPPPDPGEVGVEIERAHPTKYRIDAMTRRGPIVALVLLMTATPLVAHHAISAIYDSSKPVTVEGAVREFQFINPHPFLVIDVAEGGKTLEWRLEMDNRYELINEGMKADTLKPGDRVVASGSLSRTHPQGMYLMRLDRPVDGFRYEQVGASPRVRRGRS